MHREEQRWHGRGGRVALLLTLALAFPSSGVGQRLRLPSTRPAAVFDEFLRAYNSSGIDPLRRFFLKHATQKTEAERSEAASRRSEWVANVRRAVPTFRPYRVLRSTAAEIEVVGRSDVTEAWYTFTIEVDEAPPHGVAFGFAEAQRPPETARRGRLTDRQIARELEAYLERQRAAGTFSGAVLLAKDGRVLVRKGYGNRPETPFAIASAAKMFTAVAIARLEASGLLSYDDPIARHLPEYPNREAAERVTVRHLLEHTSGIPDYFEDPAYMALRKAADPSLGRLETYFPFFADKPLEFAPGTKFSYSNSGYVLLGAIVEAVSRRGYFDHVAEEVFERAGMANSDARGRVGSPAGSALTTVDDLYRFSSALQDGRLLPRPKAEALWTPRHATGWGIRYGYGFEIRDADGVTSHGHGGHGPGATARFDVYREEGYVVVVLSNLDPPAADNVANKARWLIAQR